MSNSQRDTIKQIHHIHYFGIVKDRYRKFIEQNESLEQIKSKLDEFDPVDSEHGEFEKIIDKSAKVRNKRDANGHIVIVFSAMFLEAIIFDFGLQKFSKRYLKNHLDNLTPKSKWVIIPKLVTGNELDTSKQTYELLDNLFKLRNDLVHSKPKIIEIDAGKFFRESEGDEDYLNIDFISSVESSIETVSKCIGFLYEISPDWNYKKFYDLSKRKNEILKSKISLNE